jgi:hypothetical protein
MSSTDKIKASCPRCSQEQEVIIWKSLNVQLSPESKQDLFDNHINILICNNCGFKSPLNVTLLYHDMEKMFCAFYIPFTSLDKYDLFWEVNERGELNDFLGVDDGVDTEEESEDYLRRPHLVFDMDELIRYVRFRDKVSEAHKAAEDYAKSVLPPRDTDDDSH